MSNGPDNVTSTQVSSPPNFLLPALGRGAFEAVEDLRNSNLFSNRTGAGIDALANRGTRGSPLVDAAQGATADTLSGQFLGPTPNNFLQDTVSGAGLSPDSNPFLQDTFNRAADLTRTRLDSEFASAGRNLGAARPARSEELQGLSSSIFGNNFQLERGRQLGAAGLLGSNFNAERNRQLGAAGQSIPLANEDFRDIGAQIDAGEFLNNSRDRNIDQFFNRVGSLTAGAGGTSSTTQPVFQDRASGALGGALTGAQLGSFIPGFGPVLGGIGGGLIGGFA